MKTKAQIRAMKRFLKRNPTYWRDKKREQRAKDKAKKQWLSIDNVK